MKYLKTKLLIASFFITLASVPQEQGFGIKGGLNVATMITDTDADEEFATGFLAGIFYRSAINKRVYLQPELLYSSKGANFNFGESTVLDGESKLRLSYVEVPVKLGFHITDKLSVQAGPYFAYLMDARSRKTSVEILEFFDIESEDDIDREYFNVFDLGLNLGLGVTLEPVIFAVDYHLGLTNVAKTGEVSYNMIGESRNSVFRVSVGVIL